MNRNSSLAPALVAAALLAACGGEDDKVRYSSVVSFGDSGSDAGAYKVGTIEALGGGKFTVNGPEGLTWTEVLAGLVKAPAQCAAQTGLLPNNGATGAPVQNFADCFNYAQGSSRVSSSGTGPNGVALQTDLPQGNLGFMAISLNEQFNTHLSKVGGSYSRTDLVTINGGANDLFMQTFAVGQAFAGGQAAVAAGKVAGWSQATLDVVALGGTNAAATAEAVATASAAAVAAMGQAGAELAGYINTLVVGKGARYVIVRNLANLNLTPYGAALDASTQGLITAMIVAFNTQLANGLSGTRGVILYDDYGANAFNPADFSNITTRACGPNATGAPNGSSIVCNTTNVIAGDVSKYLFADDVHPTPYAHQQSAATAMALMVSAGWQ